ncbi:MAG: DMT family transporter [Lachnospiraceae bacterium]|nr:DMT family transporter [Lachnospiraceae bacterium]
MNNNTKTILALNVLLMFFSLGGIFSKLASKQPFLSLKFILCYGALLFIMFVYAIGWQQIIKRLPLTMAYANRAVTIVWGIIWGLLFFNEKLNVGKIIGAVIVIAGVLLYVTESDEGELTGQDTNEQKEGEENE